MLYDLDMENSLDSYSYEQAIEKYWHLGNKKKNNKKNHHQENIDFPIQLPL